MVVTWNNKNVCTYMCCTILTGDESASILQNHNAKTKISYRYADANYSTPISSLKTFGVIPIYTLYYLRPFNTTHHIHPLVDYGKY